jgi:hypothetical protein
MLTGCLLAWLATAGEEEVVIKEREGEALTWEWIATSEWAM